MNEDYHHNLKVLRRSSRLPSAPYSDNFEPILSRIQRQSFIVRNLIQRSEEGESLVQLIFEADYPGDAETVHVAGWYTFSPRLCWVLRDATLAMRGGRTVQLNRPLSWHA
jgi:hypothetical protein